ncbi:hypothetical protein ADICYQ_1559 [Cyclobacterium qasimii M12-11B]|uniref:Uncharacterized protein n=1 Tax=Cyclobacterium qasimii M12-11B TaxID=641524 RepID=S7VIX0_9BACT|nr:hypothetical protein ADICYQ_1559 [Cyclobacterium qasimii M12-11B]
MYWQAFRRMGVSVEIFKPMVVNYFKEAECNRNSRKTVNVKSDSAKVFPGWFIQLASTGVIEVGYC